MPTHNYMHVFELSLSPSEYQCIISLSESKIIKAIAHHLALSPRTVEFHLKNLVQKINKGRALESNQIEDSQQFT